MLYSDYNRASKGLDDANVSVQNRNFREREREREIEREHFDCNAELIVCAVNHF